MSNGATGFWAATGALLGGIAGAQAGKYAAEARPRFQYASAPGGLARRRPGGAETEDAMVIGGAVGAVIGAFVGGTVAGEPQVSMVATKPAGVAGLSLAGVYFP